MMKKILAAVLEVLQLASNALLFAVTLWLSSLPAPLRDWRPARLGGAREGNLGGEFRQFLLARGPWVAGIALFAVALSGYLRGDTKRMVPMVRVVAAGCALLFTLWAFMDLPDRRLVHAWNCLFVSVVAGLVCTALMIGGAKGGSKSSSTAAK